MSASAGAVGGPPSAAGGQLGRLLRGRGNDLGPYSTRFPTEQRTLLHLLRAQAQARGDQAWLVFDGRESLTYGHADELVNAELDGMR